jgi:hypothetical protein
MMHGHEKSDPGIVAMKPANKADRTAPKRFAANPNAAEPVERRAGTKGNADQQYGRWEPDCSAVYTRGGNRMRESCKYGTVRGARGNSRLRIGECCVAANVASWPRAAVRGNAASCPQSKQKRTVGCRGQHCRA